MKRTALKRTGFKRKTYDEAKKAQSKRTGVSKKIPKRRRAPKLKDSRTKPQKKENERKLYKKLRLEFLQLHPRCQFGDGDGQCGAEATDIHHKAGRAGKLLNDTDYWMAICRTCHTWCHEHADQAKALGYSINSASLYSKQLRDRQIESE